MELRAVLDAANADEAGRAEGADAGDALATSWSK